MSRTPLAVLLLSLAGCGGLELLTVACEDPEKVWVYVDEDGDGFGTTAIGRLCGASAGQSLVDGDCDDGDASANPEGREVCDQADNDCDGEVDDDLPLERLYPDEDGDGFGDRESTGRRECGPFDGRVADNTDCDDAAAGVSPGSPEICDGIDDDCDGFADDADPDIDPAVLTLWYVDLDGDGWGDPTRYQAICAQPLGSVAQGGDCNDAAAVIHPSAPEICNGIDDDCDLLLDDTDPNIDPLALTESWVDADFDGYGDPATATRTCSVAPGRVVNGLDCNDADAATTLAVDWVLDGDVDGVGAGAVVANACSSPGLGYAPAAGGTDCDDGDPTRFPGLAEICQDGVDQDCSGVDLSCGTWMYAVRTTDGMLVRFDAETWTMQDVGPLGVYFDFGDLAYDRTSRTMYLIDGRGARSLYTVDLTTGAASLVGFHGLYDLFGLAWDGSTDTLYASCGGYYAGLYRLDQATGAPTYIGFPGVTLDALTYDFSRDQLLGLTAGYGDLRLVDRATGGQGFITSYGFVNNGGMAWDEPHDLYWVIDWSGDLFTFDPAFGYVRSTVLTGLGPHDGFVYVPDPPN